MSEYEKEQDYSVKTTVCFHSSKQICSLENMQGNSYADKTLLDIKMQSVLRQKILTW